MTEQPIASKSGSDSSYLLKQNDELIGRIDFRFESEVIDLFHTEVDPAYGGRGYGNQLAAYALGDAREAGYLVKPSCPFIAKYIQRHPEYQDLLA